MSGSALMPLGPSDPNVSEAWLHHQAWLTVAEASHWRQHLLEKIQWQQPLVQVYGKQYRVPRKTMFLAVEGLQYRYSGTTHIGAGWPDWFEPFLQKVNESCKSNFNGCLLNLYRHGEDRMGWHSDDEAEIDQSMPIASVSLGATRDFQLRHRQDPRRKASLALADGDLLLMHPGCQQQWMHCVPQRRRVNSLRINLTFRCFQKS